MTDSKLDKKELRQSIYDLYIRGNLIQAIKEQEVLIESLKPSQYVSDYNFLGLLYFSKGDYQKLVDFMNQGHELWPENMSFITNIGVGYKRLQKPEKAVPWLKKVLEVTPEDTSVHDSLCACYGKLGKLDLARKHGNLSLTLKAKKAEGFEGVPSIESAPLPKFNIDTPERNIISFSLWGNKPDYIFQAIKNAEIAPHLYPGWRCRFYCEETTVPSRVIAELLGLGADVVLMSKQKYLYEGLFWRFFVANDENVDRFLIRDADSLLNIKERYAVDEWLASDKHFHTMHDFYTHSELVLAGMWGGVGGVLPSIKEAMKPYIQEVNKAANADQLFLREEIWPIMRQSLLNHDSFFTANGARPFPKNARLPDDHHIGQNSNNLVLVDFNPGKRSKPGSVIKRQKMIFTLTTGRSGTTYLSKLFQANLKDAEVHHERFGTQDFDVQTPSISLLKQFNEIGNVHEVRRFWHRKFSSMIEGETPTYVETSHVLGKAGLLENIDLLAQKGVEVHVICLKRNIEKLVWSFYNRFDFFNTGFMWQWALDPAYKKNIVSLDSFRSFGMMGSCYWYVCEMLARIEYYQLLLGQSKSINLHLVDLEDIVKLEGAAKLFKQLNEPNGKVVLPSKTNETKQVLFPEAEHEKVKKMCAKVTGDMKILAENYYQSGQRFGEALAHR